MVRLAILGLMVGALVGGCGTRTKTVDEDTGADVTSWEDGIEQDWAEPEDAVGTDGQPADGVAMDSLEDITGIDTVDPTDVVIDPGDIPPHTPAPLTVHECKELPALAEGDCTRVTGTNDYLLIQGVVLGVQDVWVGGDVLIDGWGVIVCAGCDCSEHEGAADATEIICPEGIVSPGLINAHEHITYSYGHPDPSIWGDERYEHRHHWRCGKGGHKKIPYDGGANKEEILWVEMRMLLSGATSIAGSGSAKGFIRNLDKNDQEGLNQAPVEYETFPLGDGNCTMLDEGCDYPYLPGEWVWHQDCYLPHVSEGINKAARNEFLCLSSDDSGGMDITGPNAAFVHSIGLNAKDGEELAYNGTAVIWSPRSNISLYGNTAQAPMYNRLGVLMGLGTDWSYSGSMNMQRELQCAAFLNDNYYGGYFTDHELWLMATAGNALALAVSDVVGSIAANKVADIAIYRGDGTDNYHRAIFDGTVAETLLVLRSGVPLFGATELVEGLPETDGDKCEAVAGGICGEERTICAKRETGQSFGQLADANSGSYDLFFCGDPVNEVTCVPSRNEPVGGKYTGDISDGDVDGDGIANSQDNCPNIFNPSRPMDDGQADWDDDGIGDACDPCPIHADTVDCNPPNPFDGDGDGVLDLVDNCPSDENPEQEDGDGDQIGDACDACPDMPNPFGTPCTGTIYDVKLGVIEPGAIAKVTGVVTAISGTSYWIQVPEVDHDDEHGYQYSGMFVYKGSGNGLPEVQLGDYVEVAGNVEDWWGQLELTYVSELTIIEADMGLPEPVVDTTENLGTGGDMAEAYEGVLCLVYDGEVTELNPAAGPGDSDPTNEYVLDDALRVNDFFYSPEPFPQVGDTLSVMGILRWANGDSKLEPRNADDIIPAIALDGFVESQVFVNAGDAEVSTLPPLVIALNTWAPDGGAAIALESSDPERLTVPESVTVPAGEKTVEVLVVPLMGGVEPVVVTASMDDLTVDANVLVLGPDAVPAPVAITPDPVQLSVDGVKTVQVTLDIPGRPGGTVVSILATPADLVTAPESVVVLENEFTALFDVTGLATGTGTLKVATEAGEVEVPFEVLDVPQLGLILSEIYYNPPGSDSGKEWIEIFNGTAGEIDLSNYSIGSAGTTYANSVAQLGGTLEPGGCYVIGGPTTSDENGNPVYSLVFDFDPDIQNSGDKADAIALFDVPADQITDNSIPIDAVVYGGSNANGLVDQTGEAPEPHIGNVSSGSSAMRTPDGWLAQPEPTPNDCSHLWMSGN